MTKLHETLLALGLLVGVGGLTLFLYKKRQSP